jgi:hypothetical protein
MKTFLALAFLASTGCAFAQEPPAAPAPPTATPPVEKPAKKKPSLLDYRPPASAGTFARKDGDGASRVKIALPDGRAIELPNLYVLTPKSGVALTTKARPTIFTFQTHEVPSPVEYRVTINKPGNPDPVFITARLSSSGGIHRLDLAETDISLEPGVEYEWVVVLRTDRNKKAADVDAKGRIKRIVPDAALAEKIAKADAADLPGVYAEAGIWYDALEAISDQIAANPKDQDLVAARKTFLEKTGLPLVQTAAKPPEKPKKATAAAVDLQ